MKKIRVELERKTPLSIALNDEETACSKTCSKSASMSNIHNSNPSSSSAWYPTNPDLKCFPVAMYKPSTTLCALMRYFAFGRHLEELHVTWAHLEKKWTRLRTYTKIAQEFLYSDWRRRDENPIRTLGDYSKPSHEGYRNTIELLVGNNVVPLRSDTIRLVQNGCSFHGLRSEDPNQHLKDFLKLVGSLNLDGENRERTCLRLFQFSLRDQASDWLERLPAGSITTWEDLTTRFLAQFFPPGRTAKLRNDILIFQQHHGESLSEAWTRFKDLLQKVPHHGIDLWLQLRDLNAEESWALLEDLALYDNESWNNPRDFAKPVKAIALPQDVPSTSDRRLIELENQVQCLMEAHLAPTQPTQVNKITTSCEICSGPHDTQYCMKDPEQAFVEYASSRTDNAGGKCSKTVMLTFIDQQTNSETPINFDSDDEDEEPTPQPKTQNPKPVKETPLPKPYKPKILYPQRLRKEKMEAQYGKFLDVIRAVRINVPLIDVLAGMPNYGKFLKELISNKHKIEQISAAFLSDESSAMIQNKVPPKLGDPGSFLIPCNFNKTFSCNALADLGASINLMPYSLYAKLSLEIGKFTFSADFVILEMEEDSKVPLILGRPFLHTADAVVRVKQKQLNFIDVIDEILEEDFDALLDEGSKILHSIEGTLLEEEIFAEFDEFMAMTADENSDSESDTEDPPFEKITINTDYKIKTSIEEPPTDLKLKPLPDNLEYVFLEEPSFLPVIISSQLSKEKKNKLISVLKKHKQAFAWKTTDIPGICPSFCKHKIQLLDDKKPVVQKQRRLNPNMQEVVKKEIMKLLDTGIIYPIVDSPWVSPIHCVPKKGGITVVTNENDELVPTRTITGWRVCIDYRKLNEATAKDHFPLPFMDQMLERLAGNKYFCFLDGFFGYFQIPIDPNDQEKTTFTCPFGTYAYRRMPFGLCNAPTTFQRCMLAIFHDMIEESVEVFIGDFSVFGNSFDTCLNNLDKMLQHCKDAHLVLNWEKCHFMVKE
ncbi:reverse transcriptase domain-containing protein [Tanacetum coccineum]